MNDNGDLDERSRYEDLFVRFSSMVERWFVRLLFGLLALLLVCQLLLQFPEIRYRLVKVEQIEGVPLNRYRE
jgi:hypothetical protein